MKQRPPATDLSGPKASAESFTPRRTNLAVADVVDFQFTFFSSATALVPALPSGRRTGDVLAGMVEMPAMAERMIRVSN
jgi:hypothetical protein